ncbi:MAG: hypothetical protein U0Y68_20680 [Blastocatellia bacterium]
MEKPRYTCPAIGQQQLFEIIRHGDLPFDQLIDEFGDEAEAVNLCQFRHP